MKHNADRRPRLVWAAGVAVMVLAGLSAIQVFIAKQPHGYDLWAYVLAARHLLAGEPLYAAQPTVPFGPYGEYHYAPAAALPFVALAPLPFEVATAVWIVINTVIAAAIAVHLIRPLPGDARPWAAAAFIFFLPLILEISLGNLNLITLAFCLIAWSLRQRPAAGGAALAIAIGIKLLPLTLVLFYVASGRARLVLWTAGFGVAGVLITALAFPRDFPEYLAMLIALKDSRAAADLLASMSPAEIAGILSSRLAQSLLPIAALATAIAGGLAARRDPRNETHLHHIALAAAPYLAVFSLIWIPYLITALPLMASTLQRALVLPRWLRRASLVGALVVSWLLLQVVGDAEDAVAIASHLLGVALLIGAALVVLTLTRPVRAAEAGVAPLTA